MDRHAVRAVAEGWQRSTLQFGCDYNPEQWSRSVWLDDVRLMREAGISLVAINIFGWATIEPSDGVFDFDSLDAIIDLLHANGIRVNLGTGTSSPPPWLSTAHPEILPTAVDGTTRWPGGRQAWCPSSPVFREHALRLVHAVVDRYARHPAIALWHVSNELGCHNAHCYCDISAAAFRDWLRARYSTIDALNDAWGTAFWSQRYGTWEEILPPRATLSAANPTQRLDFCRFSSDELLDYYRAEAAVARAGSSIPVTTNFMVTAHIQSQDYWDWAPHMDIVANDHYLDHRLAEPTTELAFSADLTRGLAGGAPWMLMEQSTSAVSWQPHNVAKLPGEMLRNSLTHVARGADAVCFFQWRASVTGAEKFHSALLPHAGTDSKIWRETLELGGILSRLAEVAGSRVVAEVAIVFSWQAWWATEGDAFPSIEVRYLREAHAAYAALRAAGVTVDFVPPGGDLAGYSLVVVPTLYAISDADAASLDDYVGTGGVALITFFSGLADEADALRVDPSGATPPGAFGRTLGVWTEEAFPLLPGSTVETDTGATASTWTELVRVTEATVVSRFTTGPVAGSPAVTRNTIGTGSAWYLATSLESGAYAALMRDILTDAGVRGLDLPNGVEVVERTSDEAHYTFVINHTSSPVTLPASGIELITGATIADAITVDAGLARVVRRASSGKDGQ